MVTEQVNQCLEGFLRCFVRSCQTKWVDWIPLAEFWYNTILHSALGKTPFEVLYGHPLVTLESMLSNLVLFQICSCGSRIEQP
jgi:hypothetical protein